MKRSILIISLFLISVLIISGCQELNENAQNSWVQGSVNLELQSEQGQSEPQGTNTCGGQCGGNCEMSACGCKG